MGERMRAKAFLALLLAVGLFGQLALAQGPPPSPVEYLGYVKINRLPASDGILVEVFNVSGGFVKNTTTSGGSYSMNIPSNTAGNLTFRVNGSDTNIPPPGTMPVGAPELPVELNLSLDTLPPVFHSITSPDASTYYKNGSTISITAGLGEDQLNVSADFSSIDSEFQPSGVAVTYQGDGAYLIAYTLSTANARADGNYAIPITAIDNLPVDGADHEVTNDSHVVTYDPTAPTTSDDYEAKDGVWQNENQTITLTPECGISGCSWTKYCLVESCEPSGGTDYTVPVTISENGTTYFRYASGDNAGNLQQTRTRTVRIDWNALANNSVLLYAGSITRVALGGVELDINSTSSLTAGLSVREFSSAANSSQAGMPALGKFVELTAPSLAGNLNAVLIKLSYADAEVSAAGIDESTLRLWYYNETSGNWTKYDGNDGIVPDGGVDTVNNFVWALADHFSTWGAFGSSPPAPAPQVFYYSGGGSVEGGLYSFSITAPSSIELVAGGSKSVNIELENTGSLNLGDVSWVLEGGAKDWASISSVNLPAGAKVSLSLTVSVPAGTAEGAYSLALKGSARNAGASKTVTVLVSAPVIEAAIVAPPPPVEEAPVLPPAEVVPVQPAPEAPAEAPAPEVVAPVGPTGLALLAQRLTASPASLLVVTVIALLAVAACLRPRLK